MYFTERKSNVNIVASHDISKAYDSVSHCEILKVMMCKGFLRSVIDFKLNWYQELNGVIKWSET